MTMDCVKKPAVGLISLLICCVLLGPVSVSAVAVPEATTEATTEAASAVTTAVSTAATTAVTTEATTETAPAGDDKAIEICTIDAIDAAFKTYERSESPEQIKRIQLLLRVFGYDPGYIDGRMGKDTDGALARLCQDYKVDEYLMANEQTKDDPLKYLAARLITILEEPGPIKQNGVDCGCSREFSAMVYGFYPYLLARGEEQNIDFSLFDRIGFNMQVLDKEGDIPNRLQWSNENVSGKSIAKFISKAHKHRVKVDLTFYASDWQSWSEKTIDNAVNNIVETASQEFHGSGAILWRGLFPESIDGINLYFDEYTLSADSNRLVDIVESLAEELKKKGSAAKLNIILGLDRPGISKEHFIKFKVHFNRLRDILVDEDETIENVFIFLTKDTSKSKKALRQVVENAFRGDERKKVLRKIVPIIKLAEIDLEPSPGNDKGESQFDDDLVYLNDNYAGVGLWPLPLKSTSDAKKIEDALINNYRADDGLNYLGEKLNEYAPGLCKFVCPNRILFYLASGLLAGLLVIYALLALWNCRLREIYRRNFFYFLALFILIPLILVISLVCDPAWDKRIDRVVIGVLLLVIVGIGWRSIRKAVQPPLP